MIHKFIRIYLLLSIIASFSPLPKNEKNIENCIGFSNQTVYSPIQLARIGTKLTEESGKFVLNHLEKCNNCHQIFCSLKPIYNFAFKNGFYCSCIELRKEETCQEKDCKKSKFPFPTPTNIWNKLTCTDTRKCIDGSGKDISKKYKNGLWQLFPNYNLIVKRTSAKEIWIGIGTFTGILCFLKLTG